MKSAHFALTKISFRRSLELVLLVFLLHGCATLGNDFNANVVDQLTPEVTKKSEVSQWLGTPWRVGKEDGLTVWTYGIYKFGVFKDAYAKDLVLRFNERGILQSYSYNTTDHKPLEQ